MKRYGNLYSKICDIDNIRLAHANARRGKGKYKDVQAVDADPETYFKQVQILLKTKTFVNSSYRTFKKIDKGKEREIFSLPYFPDRIIHHCILQIIEPIWKKTLIRDTYSSIKGRGIHEGWKRVIKALKDTDNTRYCLKMDIRKFYPSVNHDVLKQIVRKKIKCKDTLWLLDEIIDSTEGIPIGNYLSQYFGNMYLSGLDHYIKEDLGCKHYFRYCDDMVILAESKEGLRVLLKDVDRYVERKLQLTLKSNYQIFPVTVRGLDFLGYRFFHTSIKLRTTIAKNFKRKIHTVKRSWQYLSPTTVLHGVMSYNGWLKYSNGRALQRSYVDDKIKAVVAACCKKLKCQNPLRRLIT